MDGQAQEVSLEPELTWCDLPECVRKALDQDLRRPSPEVLTNLFSGKDDVSSFVESLGLNMGSAEWLSACEILEKVCAEASQGASRIFKARAVQGQLAQASASSLPGPLPQLETSSAWLQSRAGAKRSLLVWPCRLAKKVALAKHDRARADAEASELERWRRALVRELKKASMPICASASYALDSQAVLEASAGTVRASTLRRHVREWCKFSSWVFAVEGSNFPSHLGLLLNYIEELAQEPCARTRLQSVLSSVIFFERVGGVKPESAISSEVLVRNLVSVRTAELEAGAPPTKQAPALALIIVMALESVVVDEGQKKFVRAFAWTRLLKLWTSSRANDLQGILPEHMVMTSQGLRGVFDRTKTSGAGRRIRWLPFFVCRDAWLLHRGWLAVGFDIWSSEGFSFARDYLVPRPTKGLTSCQPVMASYVDMSTMSKRLLWELMRPCFSELGEPTASGEPLFDDARVVAVFTEHSERNFMATLASWSGIDRERRAYLGRWHVVEASDEYIRSAWHIVTSLQRHVVGSLCKNHTFQEIGLDDLFQALSRASVEDSVRDKSLSLLQPLEGWAGFRMAHLGTDGRAPEGVAEFSLPKQAEEAKSSFKFFVSVLGKRRLRRLHRVGGCGTSPESVANCEFFESLEGVSYDWQCKHCFKADSGSSAQASRSGSEDLSSSTANGASSSAESSSDS